MTVLAEHAEDEYVAAGRDYIDDTSENNHCENRMDLVRFIWRKLLVIRLVRLRAEYRSNKRW